MALWWQFSEDNLRNARGLVDKLQKTETSISHYIRDRLSLFTLQLLDAYRGPDTPSRDLQTAIISNLNNLIMEPTFYDEQRFAQVDLTEKTRNLIAKKPQGELLICLNRLLLSEAYPDEITLCSIKGTDINTIIDRIKAGLCVPFLGAAANVSCEMRSYNGLPLGRDVATELIARMELDFQGTDPKDLARVSLQAEAEKDRPGLIHDLREIIPDDNRSPSPLLQALARLPFKLIVTTNYDRLLERALDDVGRNYRSITQPPTGFGENISAVNREIAGCFVNNHLVIYKIHGTFRGKPSDDPAKDKSSILITEDDYIEFLTMVCGIDEKMDIPNEIVRKIKTSTLLFLGYSLEDWNFRSIYKGLIEQLSGRKRLRSFAIQRDPSPFWVRFWEKKEVRIHNVDLYEFAEQLEQKYVEKHDKTEYMVEKR